jgi:hypothetical protein
LHNNSCGDALGLQRLRSTNHATLYVSCLSPALCLPLRHAGVHAAPKPLSLSY